MSTSTERFFDRLASGESIAVLGSAKGTMRFDLEDGGRTEHWRVALKPGSAAVSRSDEPADAVLHAQRSVFDELADGRLSPLPAALRGLIGLEGDPTLFIRFQRLFPAGKRKKAKASARTTGRQRS